MEKTWLIAARNNARAIMLYMVLNSEAIFSLKLFRRLNIKYRTSNANVARWQGRNVEN